MHQVVSVTLYAVLAIGIVVAFCAVVAALAAYVVPRIKHVAQGEALRDRGVAECCPPGIGCNDPHAPSRKCLRVETRRIGTVDELVQLEATWSRFCGTPKYRRTERAQAKMAYAAVRDGIVARSLKDAEDTINAGRHAQLPRHLGGGSEVV